MLSRGGCGSGGRRQSWGHRGLRADGGGGAGEAGAGPWPEGRLRGHRAGTYGGHSLLGEGPGEGRTWSAEAGTQETSLDLYPGRTPAGFLTHFPFREKNKSAARCQP